MRALRSAVGTGGSGRLAACASILVLLLALVGCAAPGLAPDDDAVLGRLAADIAPLLEAGDFDGALARVDRALERHPRIPELHAERAILALEAGRSEQAAADLRRATDLAAAAGNVDQADAYGAMLSELLEEPPEWVEQAAVEAEALPEDPDAFDAIEFWDALRGEAIAAADEGDFQGAMDLMEQALDLAEDYFGPTHRLTVETVQDLAELSFAAGDPVGTEALLSFALERSMERPGPGHPWTLEIRTTLGNLHESQGRGPQALAETEAAVAAATGAFGANAPRTLDLELLLAQRLEAVGEYARGAERLESTCSRTSDQYGRLHARTANCLEQYGILLGRGGDIDGAAEAFVDVLDIRRRVLGAQHADTLRTRLDLASMMRQEGALDMAAAELAALAEDVGDVVGQDTALYQDVAEARARTRLEQGQLAAAESLARGVLEWRFATLGDDHPLSLDVLNLLGAIYQRTGNLPAAEDTWTAVLGGYRTLYGLEHLATLTAMSNLGVVLEQQGAFDRAEPLLRTAMDVSEAMLGPAHPQTLNSMNNLALLHESQGNFSRAEPLYLLPLEILEATLGETHPRTIAIRNNLAFLYMMEQNFDRAATLFEEVHAAWVGALGPVHQDTLRGLNNLGRAYRQQGRLDEAELRISDALFQRRTHLGERHPDTVRSMIDLGVLRQDQGDLDAAETALREALERSEQVLGPEHPYTFEALNALADVAQAQARLGEAYRLRRAGFERRTRFFDRMLWVTSDNAREGYIRLHRPELDRYLQLLPELEPETAAREVLDVSLKRKGLLLDIASRIRQIAGLGLDPEMARLVQRLTEAREELAALTLAGPGEGAPETHLARMRELEGRVGDLQGQLGRASLRYREATAELAVEDLVEHLPEGSALVDFLVYEKATGGRGLLAGVLHRVADAAPRMALVLYDDMEEIEGIIQEFRQIIQDVDALDDDVEFIGNLAWEMIWQPLLEHIPADGKLYLVPDGVLNVLPFDAMVDADGRYLLETTDLHLLSSSRDLVPTAIPPSDGRFLVFGGPDYDTEEVAGPEILAAARRRSVTRDSLAVAGSNGAELAQTVDAAAGTRGSRAARFDAMRGVSLGDLDSRSAAELASLRAASRGLRGLSFSPLPGAELEGELIGSQVDAARIDHILYTGMAAEEQVLADLESPPRVLHMATHGFFLKPDEDLRRRLLRNQRGIEAVAPPPGDNPLLRAGLAFAGVNSNAPFLGEINTRNDGILTALEVLSLDLSGTRLAVLSACDTGVGEIHEGEGVYGLRRAFQEAGVREVVTSLWEVSDAGTQALMTAFYERMFEGMEPRVAFREAQRELARSPRWGYPFIWGAFVIVGN